MAYRLISLYNNFLERCPITGNCLSAGGCYTLGDYVAQKIEIKLGKRNDLDFHRLGCFALFGTVVAGPLYFTWFNKLHDMPKLLEKVVAWNQKRLVGKELLHQFHTNAAKGTLKQLSMRKFIPAHIKKLDSAVVEKTTVLVSKVLADQMIFSALYPFVFMPGTYMLLNNTKKEDWDYMLKHKSLNTDKIKKTWNESVDNIKKKYVRIYTSDWQVWPVLQMINFAFVPPHMHAIYTNAMNVPWNAYICYVSQEGH